MIKIGILKEEKNYTDKRVPFSPTQASFIQKKYDVKIYCQKSDIRCFSNEEYEKEGIEIIDNLSKCDILFGIKEIDENKLIFGKTYLFFSHTIKKQPYNRKMLKNIVKNKICLIDYECIKDRSGKRIIAFGKYAGIVGAYNALLGYGEKFELYKLKRCFYYKNFDDLKEETSRIKLPKIKIVLLGNGRAAKGVVELLENMKITKITKKQFRNNKLDAPIYCKMISKDYNKAKDGSKFSKVSFYNHPNKFISNFENYLDKTDILINATYWKKGVPKLFKLNKMLSEKFQIKLIADISCDINGLIPCTKQSSTIQNPFYNYNPIEDKIEKAFVNKDLTTIMAVDNLPSELPKDASKNFGDQLINNVLESLIGDGLNSKRIKEATISKDGNLTKHFLYLKDYIS